MQKLLIAALVALPALFAADRPGTTFKIFQFPANMIPSCGATASS
jgi:hypothetical protein